jgi:hypothetical protein
MRRIENYLTLIGKLRNAEHFDLLENIVEHIRGLRIKPEALEPVWNRFCRVFEQEDAIYKRDAGNVETRQIRQSHEKRKIAFMAFKRRIEWATYDEDDTPREAGILLSELLDKYAEVRTAPMTEVSALLFNLIRDSARSRYAGAVNILDMEAMIHRMERENEAFKVIYTERTRHLEEIKNRGNMRTIRRQVDAAAADFTNAVNVFYQANEMTSPLDREAKDILEDIITFFNSYIHQYEVIYSRRNPQYRPGKVHAGGSGESSQSPCFIDTAQDVQETTPITPSAPSPLSPVATEGILRLYEPADFVAEDASPPAFALSG